MAYRFKRREPVADAFRRISREQFVGLLSRLKTTADDGIHEARKHCKMLRALVELLSGACDARACQRADEALEKIARSLAPVRDADVRLQTLEALLTRAGPRAPQRFAHVHGLLRAQAASAHRLGLTTADLRDVAALVKAAEARLLALEFSRKGWRAIGPGITRAFRRGRRSFAQSLEDPSPEIRHQWRKRVKLLWYHVRLLQGSQPKRLAALARKLESLGETLGAEHDLAVLRQHLAQHGKRNRSPASFDGIIERIDVRRSQLRRIADALGHTLYAEKPAAFEKRLKRAWHEWRQ
jgi:CHAD domain-containing protein